MTSPGVRRLYFDDDKGDLHVFDGKDAFWRWYGAPNQYRDPLQTFRLAVRPGSGLNRIVRPAGGWGGRRARDPVSPVGR